MLVNINSNESEKMNTLKKQLAAGYLDYVNNYTSTAGFAAAHGLSIEQAASVIRHGREIHEAGVEGPQARLRHHVTGAIERGEKTAIVEKPVPKAFTVITVSSNANSFGYKSVLCLAEDGEGFEGLVQAYGTDKVPARGDVVLKTDSRWYAGVRALPAAKPADAKKILKSING